MRDDPYWTSRKNNLELIELSSISIISLVLVFCSPCVHEEVCFPSFCACRKSSLELMELSSINTVCLV